MERHPKRSEGYSSAFGETPETYSETLGCSGGVRGRSPLGRAPLRGAAANKSMLRSSSLKRLSGVYQRAKARHQPPGEPPSIAVPATPLGRGRNTRYLSPPVGKASALAPEAEPEVRPLLAVEGRGQEPALDRVPRKPKFPASVAPKASWVQINTTEAVCTSSYAACRICVAGVLGAVPD